MVREIRSGEPEVEGDLSGPVQAASGPNPEQATEALDQAGSAVRRRKKLRIMFWTGIGTFVAEVAAALYKFLWVGAAWDPTIYLALLASGSMAAAAAGIYQWGGNKRVEYGVGRHRDPRRGQGEP